MPATNAINQTQLTAKRLLYAIVFLLIFEGITRKLLPSALGLIVFFTKDILCVFGLSVIHKTRMSSWMSVVKAKWKSTALILIPVLIITLIHAGPIIVIFGLKQYLLYVVVGFLVPVAFPVKNISEFKKFIFFTSLTLFPTVAVAIIQNSLPASHWLNLSVDGGSLEGFSAAGKLRVSSTFPFTGQFSWFLNAVCSILTLLLFLPNLSTDKPRSFIESSLIIGSVMFLFIGVFITGGRTAVAGCAVNTAIGFILASLKSPGKLVKKGLIAVVVLFLGAGVIRAAKPEYFAVYDARSQGYNGQTQNQELTGRIEGGFFSWSTWAFKQDGIAILLGNGLGIMSNGSEKLSSYAARVRETAPVESDFDVTVWEGGMYLLVMWYAFRIWIILFCLKIWRSIKNKSWAVASSFLVSYVIINASLSALGKQPPLNIWLWLVIGCLITIKNYTDYIAKLNLKRRSFVGVN